MSRRVRISRYDNPGRLLSIVGKRPTRKLKKPVADDAPPLSSDDEGSEDTDVTGETNSTSQPTGNAGYHFLHREFLRRPSVEAPEDSDEEYTERANIRPTIFRAAKTGDSEREDGRVANHYGKKATTAKRREEDEPFNIKRQKLDDGSSPGSEGNSSSSSDASQRSLSQISIKNTDYLHDERGFTKRNQVKATYGKKEGGSRESERGKVNPPKKAKLRIPDLLSSPENPAPKKLHVPSDPQRLPSPPPRAVLKIPAGLSSFGTVGKDESDGGSNPLSDLGFLSDDGQTPSESAVSEDTTSTATVCPWCGDEVDAALLEDFSKGKKRLNVRMQTKFCRKHKKQTALETWNERQYPTIHWDELRDRFVTHREYLLDVVNGEPSYFRDVLARKIETGEARSTKREDNLNPGYYGSRGFNLMCDYLVGELGDILKEKAVSDRVIAGRGSAAFIQAVLVAELGARMIQEDMGVDIETARDIMQESKALGEIIHEEI